MTKREEIESAIATKRLQITTLRAEIFELIRESILLSDDKQWFTEEVEYHPITKNQRLPSKLDGKLVGRRNWVDSIMDEDTGESLHIERSEIVRIDGEWL
jgi:hypothetical protein